MPSRHEIDLATGSRFTQNFQDTIPVPHTPVNNIAGRFDRDAFDLILAQPGCTGIRIYYAIDDSGARCSVVVGTDASNNDILTLIMDISDPCPMVCAIANPLNHL